MHKAACAGAGMSTIFRPNGPGCEPALAEGDAGRMLLTRQLAGRYMAIADSGRAVIDPGLLYQRGEIVAEATIDPAIARGLLTLV